MKIFLDIADLLSMSYVKPSSTTNSTIVQDLIHSDSIAECSYCDKLDDKITNSFPLWVCKNSMKEGNKCTYIVCAGCYGENSENRKRKRMNSNNAQIAKQSNKNNCDHKNLQMFTDQTYYKPSYLSSKDTDTCYPKVCFKCTKRIMAIKYASV